MADADDPRNAQGMGAFTVLDWIGAILTGSCGLCLLLFPLVARDFAGMFNDFGSANHLPTLTRLAISVWFSPLLGTLVLAGTISGARLAPIRRRRGVIVASFVTAMVGIGLCWLGLNLPIIEMANSIKPG